MHLKTIQIPNGDIYVNYKIYKCDRCGEEIEEAWPRTWIDEEDYCWNCSFIVGNIDGKEFLSCSGFGAANAQAAVRDGEIIVWTSKKPPWELTNSDLRKTKEYRQWRVNVFERDEYTCQHCHQVGGDLNAHHIKPFAEYEDLRYTVSNGLTLCTDCHKKVHSKKK
ncbi:HNH endonuclease [Oceanobacillus sojae]|uniref:HNH nuclease domain-containing protein n=1 Tax=Oceanobacillus sojae TaxID=582851 RepID=A0A511ZIE1_9BACI|nr:HNH endonuclease [Oceanobacillus sojae]GEN87216.1 hypothetical protein OSO01_19550 [Oceanobacillus sojae]